MTTAAASELRVGPGGPLHGSAHVPGDKSITHRALICAALAAGESTVTGALAAADTRATAGALAALGARIDWRAEVLRIGGTGGRLRRPSAALDLGNSGTGLRLLAGALVGRGIEATLTGDASLRRRPMQRIVRPLAQMGADIASAGGTPPLTLRAGARLRGIHYRLPVASAQVKSAVLLAGLGAEGATTVDDPFATRDHTERLLPAFGARLERAGTTSTLTPGTLSAAVLSVPGDFSSAAFLLAAALLVPGSDLTLRAVGINPTRTGLLRVLARMGARIEIREQQAAGGEPVADLRVRAAALGGTRVAAAEVPALIDELPVLMALAAAAEGPTVIEGAGELRHKESDRIEAMRAGLAALGAPLAVAGECITVAGGGLGHGGEVHSGGDHRIAMALAVAGLAAPAPVRVLDAAWTATSFPGFAEALAAAGAGVAAA